MSQRIRSAEPSGEHLYENWNNNNNFALLIEYNETYEKVLFGRFRVPRLFQDRKKIYN